MTQTFHIYVCTQKNWKQVFKQILVHEYSQQFYISQKVETAQMYINWWMDNQKLVLYPDINMNKVLINATKCVNLKNMMLKKGSWTQRITYCMISL